MASEDSDFFMLVAGVLAAVVLVTSWWFVSGGITATVVAPAVMPSQPAGPTGEIPETEDSAPDPEAEDSAPDPDTDEAPAGPTDEAPTGDEDAIPPDAEPELVAPTVIEAIADRSDLSVLADLLDRNGLDELIGTDGEWTVFAPTNDAVTTASADDTVLSLLESAPVAVLGYHVVSGSFELGASSELGGADATTGLTTLQGELLVIESSGTDVSVNGVPVPPESVLRTGTGTVVVLPDLLLPPLASLNTLVAQEPILFAPGSATIDDASIPTLDRFIRVLERSDNPVLIGGHTDNTGDPLANQILSEDRARAVVNYLVANGVDEARLQARGFGDTDPVADNGTEAGRASNRRIEFTPG